MTLRPDAIARLRGDDSVAALVRVATAQGSTPREAGAFMVVGVRTVLGTIGGGQLEYMAIDAARAMLARGGWSQTLDIPLGPEIGQCCGGRTRLEVRRLDPDGWATVEADAAAAWAALPTVMVFGAGHVGRALAAALSLLPVRPVLVDQRPEEMALAPRGVEQVLTPLPEAEVRSAPAGSAFVVMTHDHALDFLVAREALARTDARYVGMIGSRTKRLSFLRWLARSGAADAAAPDPPSDPGGLVCPIGVAGRPDKRPEVIAAFVATEILGRLLAVAEAAPERRKTTARSRGQ